MKVFKNTLAAIFAAMCLLLGSSGAQAAGPDH